MGDTNPLDDFPPDPEDYGVEEQPEPDAACPDCGAEPRGDPLHNLKALGYRADDIRYTCSEDDCGNAWTHGVPQGGTAGQGDDLRCSNPKCGAPFGLPHKLLGDDGSDALKISLKCPTCHYVWTVEREPSMSGAYLVGYPHLTGDTEGLPDWH